MTIFRKKPLILVALGALFVGAISCGPAPTKEIVTPPAQDITCTSDGTTVTCSDGSSFAASACVKGPAGSASNYMVCDGIGVYIAIDFSVRFDYQYSITTSTTNTNFLI